MKIAANASGGLCSTVHSFILEVLSSSSRKCSHLHRSVKLLCTGGQPHHSGGKCRAQRAETPQTLPSPCISRHTEAKLHPPQARLWLDAHRMVRSDEEQGMMGYAKGSIITGPCGPLLTGNKPKYHFNPACCVQTSVVLLSHPVVITVSPSQAKHHLVGEDGKTITSDTPLWGPAPHDKLARHPPV